MCGIAGALGLDVVDNGRINMTLGSLGRRGPDANGWHQEKIGDAAATLLHTRLAVIDLDARANQPFSRDGLVLVFNGEIYNYLEISAELRARGHKLTTASDTEVLLEAYRAWGLDCLDKLDGMWAFALLDTRAGNLILCRDRFGEKPLFHMQSNGTLYFGSEPKALAALCGRPLKVNERHIRRYLANGFRSLFKSTDTFYHDVKELPAASVMIVDEQGKSLVKQYWKLSHLEKTTSADQVIEGVRERLKRTVKIRLRADVPIAFCLSGGVDSSALAAIAARELGVKVHAFSVIDSDERYNESVNIATTVAALGCEHFTLHTSTDGFFDRMADLVSYHNAPVPTISYYLHSFLSDAIASHGYKVAVSGTGADELFSGYYDHYSFWLSERADCPEISEKIAEWRSTYGRWVNNPLLQDPLLFHREPNFRGHLYQNHELFNGFLVEPFLESFEEEHYSDNLLRNRMLNELHNEVVPVILRADDMNSMRVSVENRSPYLDRELAEFLFTIPNDFLIRDGVAKWPLRQAVKGLLPDSVRLDSQKRGFNASIDSLIDRKDHETRERLLSDSPIFQIVRREAIESFLSEDMTDNSFSKFMFSFVSAKLFLEANARPDAALVAVERGNVGAYS